MTRQSRRVGSWIASLALLCIMASGCVLAIDADGDDDGQHIVASHTARCPVEGDRVSTKRAPSAAYDGEIYYFCCNTCKAQFMNQPQKYLGGEPSKSDASKEPAK